MEDDNLLTGPFTLGEEPNDSSSTAFCSDCGGNLLTDFTRGEKFCDDCGSVEEESHFEDADHSNAYNPSTGMNPGRGKLEIGRAEFGYKDAQGFSLPAANRPKFRRLENISRIFDNQDCASVTNRVVEKSLEEMSRLMPYPDDNLLNRSRDELLRVHSACQAAGESLFKTGSKWNAVAAALVCMSHGESQALFRNIKNHCSEKSLNKSESKSLRRRAVEIAKKFKQYLNTSNNSKSKMQVRFLVPHDMEVKTTLLFKCEIRDYLDRRRSQLYKVDIPYPEAYTLMDTISNVLDDEQILQYSNRRIEPILDAILLVMIHKTNPELTRQEITTMAGLSATAKSYTRMVSDRILTSEGQ